ncbi:MAG: hypothetical protein IAF38_18680, partial [Bacteroidia bacterium]|nr:hypothetical protein [Bacteroidia bacterium]
SFILFASPEKDKVISLLKSGNWQSFSDYSNSFAKIKAGIYSAKMFKTLDRQLIGEYCEEVFVFTKTYPTDSATYFTEHLLIGIIRNEKQIVFYRYYDYFNNEWKNSHPIADSSKTELKKMEDEFFAVYHSRINSADFFNAPVYGHYCGIDGVLTEYSMKVDSAIEKKDKALFDKWIRSTSLELQCYGIEGFYILKKQGILPTEEQLKLIALIKKKKGKVSVCQGCVYGEKELSEILLPFKFD